MGRYEELSIAINYNNDPKEIGISCRSIGIIISIYSTIGASAEDFINNVKVI